MQGKRIENFEYKKRFLIFGISIFLLFLVAALLVRQTLASYQSEANINLAVDHALYVFEEDMQSFNLELDGIVPRANPYIYSFSIANYNDEKESDVNIEYTLELIATTNLPLEYELYRNETYTTPGKTDIIDDDVVGNDSDGAWYRNLVIDDRVVFTHNVQSKDIYYLVVKFPVENALVLDYSDSIDNVAINVKSKQVLE